MAADPHRKKLMFDDVAHFDEYGFAVFKDDSALKKADDRSHCYERGPDSNADLVDNWIKILANWDQRAYNSEFKLKKLLKHGIPNYLRGRVWKELLNADAIAVNSKFNYHTNVCLLRKQLMQLNISEFNLPRAEYVLGERSVEKYVLELWPIKTLCQIMLDINRTFPTHIMFMSDTPAGKEGQALLFRVLAIYALYNPSVGYCQGMSYIAAMLLLFVPEEDAFWCLVALMERPKYLHGYFDVTLEKIQIHAQVFEKILLRRKPQLCNHLRIIDVDPLLFLPPWFMTLFTHLPCWDTVLFIWDLLLFEGVTAIFRVALAIMNILEPSFTLLCDSSGLMPVVQWLTPEIVGLTVLLPVVWTTFIEKWEITSLYAILVEEWQEKAKHRQNRAEVTERKANSSRKPFLCNLQRLFGDQVGKTEKKLSVLKSVENLPVHDTVQRLPSSKGEKPNRSPHTNHYLSPQSAVMKHSFAEFNSSGPFRLDVPLGVSPLFCRTPEVEMRRVNSTNKAAKCRRNLLN